MANRWGNTGNSDRLFFWAPNSLQMVTEAMKLKDACCLEEKILHDGQESWVLIFYLLLSKIAGRNINNLRYADDTTLMAETEEELKSLMKVKEESEKVGLKLNIQKTKIMVSDPITLWQIDGETVVDFIFLGFKITTDGDCSHEI